jgi:ppGpp synthetase/RelA/SpoT-type nucleotidyltranferase
MDKSQLEEQYNNSYSSFLRLKDNLEDAIKVYLNDLNIPYLAVYGRVKSFESFYEKIATKNYTDPFKQTEDFVGLRVVLYFPNDTHTVEKLLRDNFLVEQSENKSDKLEINEFGYRSHHCIIKVVKNWCKTPNYRGLEDIKSEVQIRTVLMHAWAEFEHKLQYKSKEQVPLELQRKLFLLSAKLEEADEQFEDIKNKSLEYQSNISQKVQADGIFDTSIELNLDTFRQFLIFYYPECTSHEVMEKNLFDTIQSNKLDYSTLVDIAEKFKPFESDLLEELNGSVRSNIFSYAISAVKLGVIKDSLAGHSRKSKILKYRELVKGNV